MQSVRNIGSLKGKKVLLRADFNVSLSGNKILDPLRIKAAFPTIDILLKKGACVVIVSHSDLKEDTQTLAPVAKYLSKYYKIKFLSEMPDSLKYEKGTVYMLENIRRNKGEVANDVSFAKCIARLGDVYVNEAFPVSHREHASIVGVPKYLPSYAGLQLESEIKHLSALIKSPKSPFVVIIGGAKFKTKLPLIEKFLKIADYVFVGGALSNNLLRDAGYNVGKSMVEEGYDLSRILKSKKLLLPADVTVTDGKTVRNADIADVRQSEMIIDSGALTTKVLSQIISESKTVLWNGPLGKYEDKNGIVATRKVLRALANNKKCFSVIGGGDITAVSSAKEEKQITFVSTGGGSTLEYLSKGTLPGIRALK